MLYELKSAESVAGTQLEPFHDSLCPVVGGVVVVSTSAKESMLLAPSLASTLASALAFVKYKLLVPSAMLSVDAPLNALTALALVK